MPNEDAAKLIAQRVEQLGYVPSIEYDDENEEWACYCSKRMIPTYDAVVAAQCELDIISSEHDGYTDGWGTFGADAN